MIGVESRKLGDMPFFPGSRLGPYQMLAPLGAGGMGQVCKAEDTRLGRAVALKFLPDQLSTDRQALERFATSGRLPIVVLEQPTQPLLTSNASRATLRGSRPGKQQLVRLTLVIPLAVIMFAEVLQSAA